MDSVCREVMVSLKWFSEMEGSYEMSEKRSLSERPTFFEEAELQEKLWK
jgi:hypothetical protein